jgi:hypothetical protein
LHVLHRRPPASSPSATANATTTTTAAAATATATATAVASLAAAAAVASVALTVAAAALAAFSALTPTSTALPTLAATAQRGPQLHDALLLDGPAHLDVDWRQRPHPWLEGIVARTDARLGVAQHALGGEEWVLGAHVLFEKVDVFEELVAQRVATPALALGLGLARRSDEVVERLL